VKNDSDSPRLRDWREVAALGLLLAAIALSAWRFYRIRNYVEFVDESAETTTGWLVSEGASLYGSVFSHHMPLAVIVSHVVASLSPTDHPAHFRAAPWAEHVLLALAIAFGPCGRRRPAAGAAAGASFLALSSAFAPLIWAHLALNEVLWGLAFAMFLVLLPLPILFREEPRPIDALVAVAAASLSLAGSPVAAMPLAFGVVLVVVAMPRALIPSRAGAFLVGAGVAAGSVGAWLWRFGDFGGFLEEGFRFNQHVYARFLGHANTFAGVVRVGASDWGSYFFHAIRDSAARDVAALLVPPILAVGALVAFAVLRRRRHAEGFWRAMALVALYAFLVFSLRIRGGEFRAIPLYLAIFATAALLPWAGGFRREGLVAGIVVLSFLPLLAAAARHESLRFHDDTRQAAEGTWWHVARYIETHSGPDERIASYPIMPIVYLETHRRPATDSVFFLPWQAAWEEENPARPSTCTQLRARPPRYVALQYAKIWGYFPWDVYAGCIDRFLKDEYETVKDPELGGLLLERKSALQQVRQ
jgi:hypothetical protein